MSEIRRSVDGRYCGTIDFQEDVRPDRRGEAQKHGAGGYWWRIRADGSRALHVLIPAETERGFAKAAWPILPARLENGDGWNWDGNVEEPTLNPSLHAVGIWRGWMEAGRLRSV